MADHHDTTAILARRALLVKQLQKELAGMQVHTGVRAGVEPPQMCLSVAINPPEPCLRVQMD